MVLSENGRIIEFLKRIEKLGKSGETCASKSRSDSGFKKWCEFIKPITKRRNAKSTQMQICFDDEVKTHHRRLCGTFHI